MNKKIATFVVAMVLLLGVTLGITFALMTAETKTITNTFVAGGFGTLELWETPVGDSDAVPADELAADPELTQYTVIPGTDITKDPFVTFDADNDSNEYYLFIKLDSDGWVQDGFNYAYSVDADGAEGSNPAVNLLSFEVVQAGEEGDIGWIQLEDNNGEVVPGVFYNKFNSDVKAPSESGDGVITGSIIEGDKVSVLETATYEEVKSLPEAGLELSFTAYAIQTVSDAEHTTAFDHWNEF